MLYLTIDFFPIFVPLGVIGFYRYLILFIKLLAWGVYRPIRPLAQPLYRPEEDVTIVVPTIDAGEECREATRSWLACHPREILIVTEESMVESIQTSLGAMDPSIKVLSVPKANKREQMVQGIRQTKTDILVFADDDAIWRPTMLEYMLACFEDESVGGVGTSQAVKPQKHRMSIWEILAGFRLTIRNIEMAASTHIDGGASCLSGRTAAYRTVILKDPTFQNEFVHDYWRSKYRLNSGDDKFLTRWMLSRGWSTYIQVCPEAQLLSTFKNNWRFLKQVLRWTRNTWRSDLRSLFVERHIWFRYPFVTYTMIDNCLKPLTLLSGPASVAVLCFQQFHLPGWNVVASYLVWLLAVRFLKLLPHLIRRPQDITGLPAFLLFNFYFAFMKIYALCTLHKVGWGTRAGVTE
ncbi:hypothetical protein EC973_001103 [Apophysomyces ossiformis]|uniref:Glycosyltransferase family 2 protein n=1 Tax=Apophysomyces ossiformis TaxID=679940 RepID=A0A8H7BK23_9FUNG|nr:hypothetical protein EC973_001103 [Apophysomyces ossiformis]